MLAKAKNLRAQLVDCSRSDGQERIKYDVLERFEEACLEGRIGLDPTGSKHDPNRQAAKSYRIQDVAQALLGDTWEQQLTRGNRPGQTNLLEDGVPVTSSLFPQITQQLLLSEVRRQFQREANVFTPLVPVIPSDIQGTEIVPSITSLDPDDMKDVGEGNAYPRVIVTEEYFTVPGKSKKGAIIELTREAIRFDRTNMLVDQAREIGGALGATREDALIDAFIGVLVNNYSRNGTASDTFLAAGAYINRQVGLALTDWTDVDAATQLFAGILDPNTGQPLQGAMTPQDLIVMPALRRQAQRILTATGARSAENAAAGTRSEETLNDSNPIGDLGLRLVSSIRLYRRALAAGVGAAAAQQGWFLGTLSEMLAWYECWELQLFQQGADSDDSFDRDIEMKFKANYFGQAVVREPRKMLRNESTTWTP